LQQYDYVILQCFFNGVLETSASVQEVWLTLKLTSRIG